MVPSHFSILYDADSIASRVRALGEEITSWATSVYDDTGQDILTIPLLRGGIFFFGDLVRHISCSVDLSPVRASSYLGKAGNVSAPEVKASLDETEPRGRAILLIDDICDSGRTLDVLTRKLTDAGAASVRSAVLVKRELPDAFEPDWSGFRYKGDEWLVGYGMDDRDRWRNLPSIYIIGSEK